MHVLIICSYLDDSKSTGAIRMAALRRNLISNNIKVSCITPDIYDAEGVYMISDYVNRWSKIIPFSSSLLRIIRKLLYFTGGIYFHSLYRKAFNKFKLINSLDSVDIIIASSPQAEILDVGTNISKSYNLKLICDFRDGLLFEPLYKYNFIERAIYSKIEKEAVQQAEHIITVSKPITDYFKENYKVEHVTTITNGFTPLANSIVNKTVHASLDKTKFNIVYTGKISKSRTDLLHSLKFFIDTFNKLELEIKQNINVLFLGDFSESEKALFPNEFLNLGIMSRQTALQYQMDSDYLLLFTGTQKSVVTGKLFEYIQAGKPILSISNGSYAENIINSLDAGVCFSDNESDKLLEYLNSLVKNEKGNIPKNLENYSHTVLFEQYKNLIEVIYSHD